jgi:hypothetical protein
MEEWKEFRLGDIISIAGGFAYKGDLIGKGQNYLLGMGCVSFNENFLDKGARQYDGDCPERYYATPGDIVLATRQQSDNMPILGMPAIIPSKYEGCKIIVGHLNTYIYDSFKKQLDNTYLYAYLLAYVLISTPSEPLSSVGHRSYRVGDSQGMEIVRGPIPPTVLFNGISSNFAISVRFKNSSNTFVFAYQNGSSITKLKLILPL